MLIITSVVMGGCRSVATPGDNPPEGVSRFPYALRNLARAFGRRLSTIKRKWFPEVRLEEISEKEFYKLAGAPWLPLEDYRVETFTLPCQSVAYYVDPGKLGCQLLKKKDICNYKAGRIELADELRHDRIIQWSGKLTKYQLPSNITVYEVDALVCKRASSIDDYTELRRFYCLRCNESLSDLELEEVGGSCYVSPDGTQLLRLSHFPGVLIWNLVEGKTLKREEVVGWISYTRRGSVVAPCASLSIHAVLNDPEACVCRVEVVDSPYCEGEAPRYYLISW